MTDAETALFLERVRQYSRYDPETGHLIWIKYKSNKAPVGSRAGSADKGGYLQLGFDGRDYKVHRVAWLMVHGRWPEFHIDHINGVVDDNRISNLRDVPAMVNCQNKLKPRKGNRLGIMGVYLCQGAYTAQITVNSKLHYLGRYKTPGEAHGVYMQARRKMHEGNTL